MGGCNAAPFAHEENYAVVSPVVESTTASATPAVDISTAPIPSVENGASTPTSSSVTEPITSPSPISAKYERATTAAELTDIVPPLRDQIALAEAYLGVGAALATAQPVANWQVGAEEIFYVNNIDSNIINVIDARLMSIGRNALFWFDQSEDLPDPDQMELAGVTEEFDRVFDTLFSYFGLSEDEDKRIHIVHASPSSLCDSVALCGLAGYFSSRDELPKYVDPKSNERDMFVMNTQQFGLATYIDTLAHELRHYLGRAYDLGDEDWFIEGAAMLAEDLAGFSRLPQLRGNLFLVDPDQQLNAWQDSNASARYGQGYLVNRFLYDKLGPDLYREYSMSSWPGLTAVDYIAAAHGLDVTGEDMWLDWLVSMALLGYGGTPERYRWAGPVLDPMVFTSVEMAETYRSTVNQYAADYYELPTGPLTIEFSGAPTVSLLGLGAPSGNHYWYAQRANSSDSRLTRPVDLRDVSTATLDYKVYYDLEEGYDFAYVSVSTDGGRTWQGVVADGMQGLKQADDPAEDALTDRFYTGNNGRWIAERVDLSPFSGQEILLRFEYVTDLILTYSGFAIDDIAIPEIGFFDDAEILESGWIAEGFTRATVDLIQGWPLQLVTFDENGVPMVARSDVADDGRLTYFLETLPDARRPILIVAALAPETLQAAPYILTINP